MFTVPNLPVCIGITVMVVDECAFPTDKKAEDQEAVQAHR